MANQISGQASAFGGHRPRSRWLRIRAEQLTVFNIVSVLVVVLFAFLAVYPLSRVLVRAFYNDGQIDFSPLQSVFSAPEVGTVILNTIIVVFASAVISLVIGAFIAWLNERTDARMGMMSEAMPLLPFLVPPIAGAIGWVLLLSDRAGLLNAVFRSILELFGISLKTGPFNIYTWPGLIFVFSVYSVPYVYMMISSGLRNLDSSMEEQSRICGRGLFHTLIHVTIPCILPSLGAATLLLVWFGFSLFSVPAIIGQGAGIEVLAVRLVRLLTFTYPPRMAEAIGLGMIIVAALASTWCMQTWILRRGRHATISGKGQRSGRIELGFWKWPARSVVLGYLLVAAILPLVGLLIVALHGFWTPNLQLKNFSLKLFTEAIFLDRLTQRSMLNSLTLGVVGATLGIIAAAIITLFVLRSGNAVSRIVDGMIKMPAAISNIVLAVGLVLAFSGWPFYLNGTFLILLIGYLVLYLPQASVSSDAAAAQVGKDLIEASSISGASGGRTLWRISLPLMVPGLVAGWALLFVRMISDLTGSAILAGTSNPVVGFRILEVYEGGSFALLAALSTVITFVGAAVVTLVLYLSRRIGPPQR